jgi:hypothetical protein
MTDDNVSSSADQPNIFDAGFGVEACKNGSFVVHQHDGRGPGWNAPKYAFSNIMDMMAWLGMQAGDARSQEQSLPDRVVLYRQSGKALEDLQQ